MNVLNVHEREFRATPAQVGALIDSLASREDALWPRHAWPRMVFDRPLGIGAAGGHGPIRYVVGAYTPARSISFRFTGPAGFDGGHGLEVVEAGDGTAGLRHTLAMTTRGVAVLSWLVAFRPLHDALLEDALATAQASLGEVPKLQAWSRWVRLLRWTLTGGKAPAQVAPTVSFERTHATAGPAG